MNLSRRFSPIVPSRSARAKTRRRKAARPVVCYLCGKRIKGHGGWRERDPETNQERARHIHPCCDEAWRTPFVVEGR